MLPVDRKGKRIYIKGDKEQNPPPKRPPRRPQPMERQERRKKKDRLYRSLPNPTSSSAPSSES